MVHHGSSWFIIIFPYFPHSKVIQKSFKSPFGDRSAPAPPVGPAALGIATEGAGTTGARSALDSHPLSVKSVRSCSSSPPELYKLEKKRLKTWQGLKNEHTVP